MNRVQHQTRKKFQAVIFDLDGVIVDSEPLHFEAHKQALAAFGLALSLEDYLAQGVAMGDEHLYRFEGGKFEQTVDVRTLRALKKKSFTALFEKKGELRPGVWELIQEIQGIYQLGIASSGTKHVVELCLKKFDMAQFFPVVVTAADVQQVKPAPDLYQTAADRMQLEPKQCLAIEDSESGLIAAKRAGIACAVVPCDFTQHQDFSSADYLFHSFDPVRQLLL